YLVYEYGSFFIITYYVIYFFLLLFFFFFFFFFQAEDGIRDKLVTGVQTCALPICQPSSTRIRGELGWRPQVSLEDGLAAQWSWRSEERRVGKECRSRWSPDQ